MKKIIVPIAVLCVITSLCGCGGEQTPSEIFVSTKNESSQAEEERNFPAASCGVELQKAVERAVSLSPAATEMIYELGFEGKLVGVSDYCDYPENSLPRMGSTENPDIRGIIELEPDAVFTLSLLSERDIYELENAGIAVLTPDVPKTVEEYSALYREISAAFYGNISENGRTKTEIIAENALKNLENAAADTKLGKFIYITEKLTAAGGMTFENAVLSLSGENFCRDEGYIPVKDLSEIRVDKIIASDKLTRAAIKADPRLSAAVSAGAEIIFVPSALFERPSARTAKIFEEINKSAGN